MKIVQRTPNWFSPVISGWPGMFDDEDWLGASKDLSVFETDDDLVIKANVAGVPAEKVDVSIEGGVVTIRATHEESEEEKKKKKVVYHEARKAQYVYSATIPCPIVEEKAKADVKNGVLTLTLPKAEENKPKKIKVTATGK